MMLPGWLTESAALGAGLVLLLLAAGPVRGASVRSSWDVYSRASTVSADGAFPCVASYPTSAPTTRAGAVRIPYSTPGVACPL